MTNAQFASACEFLRVNEILPLQKQWPGRAYMRDGVLFMHTAIANVEIMPSGALFAN